MDLTLEEDFDSELLMWDNEDDDNKNVAREGGQSRAHSYDQNIGTLPNANAIKITVQEQQQPQQPSSSSYMNINGQTQINYSNVQRPATTTVPLNSGDNVKQPLLNKFITATADKSSSKGQTVPSKSLNADTGLQLFLTASGRVQDNSSNAFPSNMPPHNTSIQQTVQREPQQNNLLNSDNYHLEPIFPPNFFLSGLPSWEPQQAMMINADSFQQSKGSTPVPNANITTSGNDTKNSMQQQGDDFWDHVKVSQHIAMLHANQTNNNLPKVKESVTATNGTFSAPNNANAAPAILANENNNNATIPLNAIPPLMALQAQIVGRDQQIHEVTQNTSCSNNVGANLQKKRSKSRLRKPSASNNPNSTSIPPFYLFDAPIELRHNFMKTQQAMNIPIFQDSNSYHYKINSQTNPLSTPSSLFETDPKDLDGKKVKLLDARQKTARRCNERNEREQQRAQKITELIDKLRTAMVHGGWKVEMKSKYQTLATCTDYLNHLKAVAKEKQEKLQKTKADLAMRMQKLKEEKVLLESRSDPESVISSLTAASSSSNNAIVTLSPNLSTTNRKRQASQQIVSEGSSGQSTKKSCTDDGSGMSSNNNIHEGQNVSADKMSSCVPYMTDGNKESMHGQGNSTEDTSKHKGSTEISYQRSEDEMFLGEDNKKMSSSVSDMTDSNKGSSDGNERNKSGIKAKKSDKKFIEVSSQRFVDDEVSSTAVVVSGISNHELVREHADVVIKMRPTDRKRKRRDEKTSLENGFELNYEEVFLKSNVPQIIATPAGRIVTCNVFFYRLTGITEHDIKTITIFSLVKAEMLSSLYEFVAEALRKGSAYDGNGTIPSLCSSSQGETSSRQTGDSSLRNNHFDTITLSCINFPKNIISSDCEANPCLFMHITFMWNEDPSKRCLHCSITDKVGADGKNGFISSKLLAIVEVL